MKSLRWIALVVSFLGALLALWAFWLEPASLRVSATDIHVQRWPEPCNGLRIAVLADLHVGSPYKGLSSLHALVLDVNAAVPDLILLPGDFVIQGVVGGSFVAPEDAAKVLSKLRAPMGVFAVLGNHDWWLGAPRVANALTLNQITVLEDESVTITNADCDLQLVGISDYWEGPHDHRKALRNIPEDRTIVAFTHNPDIFPELPLRIALTIAGHTHGGQVHFPGIGRPIVPSNFGERFAIGHIVEQGKHLYVSAGVGTSIMPVRFRVPPEVTILNIRQQ